MENLKKIENNQEQEEVKFLDFLKNSNDFEELTKEELEAHVSEEVLEPDYIELLENEVNSETKEPQKPKNGENIKMEDVFDAEFITDFSQLIVYFELNGVDFLRKKVLKKQNGINISKQSQERLVNSLVKYMKQTELKELTAGENMLMTHIAILGFAIIF